MTSLSEVIPYALAEELEDLAEISKAWNPKAEISIALVLPDETLYGYLATEPRISASAVKPLWAAAALEAKGVDAVSPLAHSALTLSGNSDAGKMIDLAGGVDAVNLWTRNVAGLAGTRLDKWGFGDSGRVAEDYRPENPIGNRTTMADLALFYVRLRKGELLGKRETAALEGWLLDTSNSLDSLSDFDGALLDRLPPQVAEASLHKAGWLPPNCCAVEYRVMIGAGAVILPDGSWFGLAITSAWGEFYYLTTQWVALAACRIYAVVVEDSDLTCEREGDGVHYPGISPETESDE